MRKGTDRRFSDDFSEVGGLRSRRFQFQVGDNSAVRGGIVKSVKYGDHKNEDCSLTYPGINQRRKQID